MTTSTIDSHDRVTAEVSSGTGEIVVSATLAASPERVFRALASEEICAWWVRPGVFDTREWSGELREGGRWSASGVGGGRPYGLEGTFVEIDAPRRLVHTWKAAGAPGEARVSYDVEPRPGGVRLTLRHSGLMDPEVIERTRAGWETSLVRLREILAAEQYAPAQ